MRLGAFGLNGSREFLAALDPKVAAGMFHFGDVAGSFGALGDGGIAVSKSVADDHNWKLDDTLDATFVKTGDQPLKIDYIFDENTFGDYYISLGTYEQNYVDQLDSTVFANLKPGVSADDGRRAIEAAAEPYPNAKVQDNAQFKADQQSQINTIVALIYALLFLALFIALIGIANTLALSITERTRELGLLRAVGMSRAQVRSSVRWESVIISLLGTINGLAIGLFFGWSVVRALRDEGFSTFAYRAGAARDRRGRARSCQCRRRDPSRAPSRQARHPARHLRPVTAARRRRLDGVWRRRWLGAALVALVLGAGCSDGETGHRDDDTGGVGAMWCDRDQTVRGA